MKLQHLHRRTEREEKRRDFTHPTIRDACRSATGIHPCGFQEEEIQWKGIKKNRMLARKSQPASDDVSLQKYPLILCRWKCIIEFSLNEGVDLLPTVEDLAVNPYAIHSPTTVGDTVNRRDDLHLHLGIWYSTWNPTPHRNATTSWANKPIHGRC